MTYFKSEPGGKPRKGLQRAQYVFSRRMSRHREKISARNQPFGGPFRRLGKMIRHPEVNDVDSLRREP